MDYEEFDQSYPAPGAVTPLMRLQYLVDNTPGIIYCMVPSGDFKMTFVSNSAYTVLGYRPDQMVADPNFWFDHIHPDDTPAIFSSLALLFVEGARTYEYRFRRADGNYLWMHDSLHLVRDEHGAPHEVIGTLTDITLRKQMEQALHAKGQEQQALIVRLQEAHDHWPVAVVRHRQDAWRPHRRRLHLGQRHHFYGPPADRATARGWPMTVHAALSRILTLICANSPVRR
jgi:two-component system NtrC family sensor kinase